MPMPLRQRLNELASSLTSSLLDALRGASLEDLFAESSGRGGQARPARASADAAQTRPTRRREGRLPRRSASDIAQVVEGIVGLLRQSPKGLRAEQIHQKLGVQAKELPRPLKDALDAGRLGKSGQKRATTYFLKGGGGVAKNKKATGRASPRGARGARVPRAPRARPARPAKRGRRASAARTQGTKRSMARSMVDNKTNTPRPAASRTNAAAQSS